MEENLNTSPSPTPQSAPVQNNPSSEEKKKEKVKLNKTMFLVAGLVVLTGVLLIVSIKSKTNLIPDNTTSQTTVEKDYANSSLSVSEEPRVISNGNAEVDINVDSADNVITGTQIELSYDPKVLTNVDIKAGTFFDKPNIVYKNIDKEKGRITLMIGENLGNPGKKGAGSVAVLTFTKTAPEDTNIDLLPDSIVTAEGQDSSVLKETSSAVIGDLSNQVNSASPNPSK